MEPKAPTDPVAPWRVRSAVCITLEMLLAYADSVDYVKGRDGEHSLSLTFSAKEFSVFRDSVRSDKLAYSYSADLYGIVTVVVPVRRFFSDLVPPKKWRAKNR